jgi:hypothetical protein
MTINALSGVGLSPVGGTLPLGQWDPIIEPAALSWFLTSGAAAGQVELVAPGTPATSRRWEGAEDFATAAADTIHALHLTPETADLPVSVEFTCSQPTRHTGTPVIGRAVITIRPPEGPRTDLWDAVTHAWRARGDAHDFTGDPVRWADDRKLGEARSVSALLGGWHASVFSLASSFIAGERHWHVAVVPDGAYSPQGDLWLSSMAEAQRIAGTRLQKVAQKPAPLSPLRIRRQLYTVVHSGDIVEAPNQWLVEGGIEPISAVQHLPFFAEVTSSREEPISGRRSRLRFQTSEG